MSRSMALGTSRHTSPLWLGSPRTHENMLPGGAKVDAAQFNKYTADVAVQLSAAAAEGAATLSVDALSGPIPAGYSLNFGPPGLRAVLTAAANTGATTLQIVPLVRAIPDDAKATFYGYPKRMIQAGTLVGRTYAERASNPPVGFGPAAATDDEIYLLAFDIPDADELNDAELMLPRAGVVVKENFLPDWYTISQNSQLLAALRALYNCTRGAE